MVATSGVVGEVPCSVKGVSRAVGVVVTALGVVVTAPGVAGTVIAAPD